MAREPAVVGELRLPGEDVKSVATHVPEGGLVSDALVAAKEATMELLKGPCDRERKAGKGGDGDVDVFEEAVEDDDEASKTKKKRRKK